MEKKINKWCTFEHFSYFQSSSSGSGYGYGAETSYGPPESSYGGPEYRSVSKLEPFKKMAEYIKHRNSSDLDFFFAVPGIRGSSGCCPQLSRPGRHKLLAEFKMSVLLK